VREIEIVECILNSDAEYYNYRISRNTPEVEVRLEKIYEAFEPLDRQTPKESQNESDQSDVNQIMADASTHSQVLKIAVAKRPQYTSYYFVHNINLFNKYKGFEGILAVLKYGHQQHMRPHGISMLKLGINLMTLVNNMRNVFRDDFWLSGFDYGTQIALACYDFVQSRCTAEDVRVAHKKDIQYFASNVESILDSIHYTKSAEEKIEFVYQISESLELEIAL
jgi:hypothetical protein